MHDAVNDLEVLVRSRYGLIIIETDDEDRAATLLELLADRLGIPFFSWTRTKGLRRQGAPAPSYDTQHPARALVFLEAAQFPAIFHMRGFGAAADDPQIAAALRDALRPYEQNDGAIVMTGTGIPLPDDVARRAARVSLAAPSEADYRKLLSHLLRDLSERRSVHFEMTPAELNRLIVNLRGLTLLEAEKVLTKAMVEDGRLTAEDVGAAIEAKKQIVEREGLLEYYPAEEAMADVADLAGLKDWLAKRRAIIAEPARAQEFGLEFPKGVLLLGVPGCGKSLCAKAVAAEWGLPLLKLDTANLYNKYIGESEQNFKRAMETAERTAPVVLWIDELEKAFAESGGEDGGVGARVLGGFLSWMQERRGDVFVVATANDVSRLRPEFLRKGRFDEIFFVDLPDAPTREAIFEIHLRRRGHDSGAFDVSALAAETEGFSGAEIEQVILSALYTAFSDDGALTQSALVREARATAPLSETMRERIEALRAWARDRTVSAQ